MAEVIAVSNQKGGVGKTTTAINLGGYLAVAGKKTAVVDLDPQANATVGLGLHYGADTPTLFEVLTGQAAAETGLQQTTQENLFVLPSTPNLAGAVIELLDKPYREFRLRRALKPLREQFDFILIDCPPSLGLLTVNGLVAADRVLVPVQCEFFALEGLQQLLQTVALVREHLNPRLQVLGAVLTMFDRRTAMARKIVRDVRRTFPGHVFDSVIPRNTELSEAPSAGQTILHYAAHSRGAKAYEYLSEELINLYS
ncbi:MAG: sporulation initiation inhibitor Soj [Candidatus Andersenbacteria bacterium CG10_big_fil_rev_8_21_14_0_10_54_11]|uniref:Sporulation initiation inhibitor Soj n=1 Tax=Candidatus Andersenbacteria bacterium CG10_big_fil_rev_8_21_14_0_10_54_11 TaxID=1974485 RepID=A0A2M6WZY6_9BACT|nr:MAG: sporulation initiation inhibitor Soj [Candidatus Andersenbacteria bacterium CG10_big_fil_rev_8_21_14_0_10_54_11]